MPQYFHWGGNTYVDRLSKEKLLDDKTWKDILAIKTVDELQNFLGSIDKAKSPLEIAGSKEKCGTARTPLLEKNPLEKKIKRNRWYFFDTFFNQITSLGSCLKAYFCTQYERFFAAYLR